MIDLSAQAMRQVLLASTSLIVTTVVFAQGIPDDRNINIVGVNPPTAETGVPDTGLKQQNEPACAMKPSNPLQILCAFNDYRGVDNPAIGDAWEGYSYSINGGQTWFSDLLPAHPGDTQNVGLDFAADPQVVAAPGIALISYIAADRGENAEGGLFLQRLFEVNREAGAPWVPAAMPSEVDRGNADKFIDKPFMLLHPAPAGSGTVTVDSTLEDGTPVSQDVPAARLFLAYTIFSGTVEDADLMSKILVAVSDDYGDTWETRVLANSTCQMPGQGHCKDKGQGHKKGKGRGHSKRRDVIQSASLAAYGDKVCAVWRRFEDLDDSDAIMASCSTDRGETFAIPSPLVAVPDFSPFDQGTTEATFRTNSYPVIAHDGSKFYAFWASRDVTTTPFFARIVYSTTVDGSSWTAPVMLEDAVNGHQFMPAVATARTTIQLAWYDTRNNLFQADFIQDRPGDGIIPAEDSEKIIRNKGDIRTAQIVDGVLTDSVQVSRYIEGALVEDGPVQQLEFNFMNDRIFKQGTVPFAGDYPNVAAPTFRLDGAEWVSNIGPSNSKRPVDFLVSWSDNRDVRGNVWEDLFTPTVYTPADLMPTMTAVEGGAKTDSDTKVDAPLDTQAVNIADPASKTVRADAEEDATAVYGTCVPGTNADRSRNQNVYSSIVRPGVSIDSPSASKPTGAIQRAHVIWVSNNEPSAETYTLTIDNQPSDAGTNGRASFLQVPVAPFPDATTGLLTEIEVTIDPNSTVARTVYVTSQTAEPEIGVSVSDGGSIVFGTIRLNADILTPDVQNPDVQNPDVQNPDIQNAEVHNPDVQNVVITRVQNPDVQNPDVQNPDVQNPDVQNPDVQNPDVQNPDIQNPDVQNTSLDGSGTENPDLANDTLTPAEKEEGYTDITWEVTNDGNTTTSFNLDAFIKGDTTDLNGKTQLIATRTHVTETSKDCVQGKLVQNQVIFNEINPDLGLFSGNSDDGVFGDGSAYIAPGETILVTLRVWGDPLLFDAQRAAVRVESQSCNSVDKSAGTTDCDPPAIEISGTTLLAFDFENALAGDLFALASFETPVLSGGFFSGTKNDRRVVDFGQDNDFTSSALFPANNGGFFVYLSFTTTEQIEISSLQLTAGTNEPDTSDGLFDVLLSPVGAASPIEGDLRIPALNAYTSIGTFAAPALFLNGPSIGVDLIDTVLVPGTYHIAIAPATGSGIDVGTTQLIVDNVKLQGAVVDVFAATVDFEFIPPLLLNALINPINSQLAQFGVRWEEQGGVLRLSNEGQSGSFGGLSGTYLAFNTNGQFDGTHTARFMCPDGSGRRATVSSANINVSDTESVTVAASSFNASGGLLETFVLPDTPVPGNPGTFSFTTGLIASIEFTDLGGDGHLLDNLVYEGSQCFGSPITTFTQALITGDTDILNNGALVAANDLGTNPTLTTVNGVNFGTDQTGPAAGQWIVSGGNAFSFPDEFSLQLEEVLDDLVFVAFGRASLDSTFTIGGLTQGRRYRLQLLLSNDTNSTADNIEVTVEGATWEGLNSWQPDAINLTVEFTASGSSVAVVMTGGPNSTSESGRGILNSYAIHDLSPIVIP